MSLSPLSVMRDVAGPPDGQRIVDVGCGAGALVAALAAGGYAAEGVEPGQEAIAAARQASPHLRFHHAGAEHLPLEDGTFDVAVMVNALHHVPLGAMPVALAEMHRVLKRTGRMVVIEPSVTGSFFEVLRLIEDETLVRNAAQAALDRATASGAWRTAGNIGYDREESFATAEDFIARVVAVDPARAEAVSRNRNAIVEAFTRFSVSGADGMKVLVQPIVVRVFAPQ